MACAAEPWPVRLRHPPILGNGGTPTRHMAIEGRGTAPDLPCYLGSRHGAGGQHRLRRRDLHRIQNRRSATNTTTGATCCQCGSGTLAQ